MTADVDDALELYALSKDCPLQAFLLNNTANWQPGTIAAYEAVSAGKIGTLRHISCVFASPLGWLLEGTKHELWTKASGSMLGNGFGWAQFSHTFGWIFKVTGLIPKMVYCSSTASEKTGADLYNAVVITCTNGCTINASGVGSCPDGGFKIAGNWLFGTKGMMSYNCLASYRDHEDKNENVGGNQNSTSNANVPHLEIWTNDGTHEIGPPALFENIDKEGTGPGSLDAFVKACNGLDYFNGAGPVEGLKSVSVINAMYQSAKSGRAENVCGCDDL